MICPQCASGDHGTCRTNERWGQPTRTGLSPLARDTQKRTWCFCQHRVPVKTPTVKPERAAEIPPLPRETTV